MDLCYTNTCHFISYFLSVSGPFCGSKLPSAIQSKGNRLVIRFQTDLFTEGKGFRAHWTTDPSLPAPTEAPVPPNPWDNITIGGVLVSLVLVLTQFAIVYIGLQW